MGKYFQKLPVVSIAFTLTISGTCAILQAKLKYFTQRENGENRKSKLVISYTISRKDEKEDENKEK